MDTKQLREAIEQKKYEVTDESVLVRAFPSLYNNEDNVSLSERRAARAAYDKLQYELEKQFKHDALEAVGLANHPNAGIIISKAWDSGHASGCEEVLGELEELAELFVTKAAEAVITKVIYKYLDGPDGYKEVVTDAGNQFISITKKHDDVDYLLHFVQVISGELYVIYKVAM